MKVYQVLRTEATKNFSECVYIETLSGIFAELPGSGFFKHPTFSHNHGAFKAHLERLKAEGFEIKESTFTARA